MDVDTDVVELLGLTTVLAREEGSGRAHRTTGRVLDVFEEELVIALQGVVFDLAVRSNGDQETPQELHAELDACLCTLNLDIPHTRNVGTSSVESLLISGLRVESRHVKIALSALPQLNIVAQSIVLVDQADLCSV